MKILDFHTHAYPDQIADRLTRQLAAISPDARRYGNGTLEALLERNRSLGITACVQHNIAAGAGSVARLNRFAVQNAAVAGVYPFGTLHPDMPPVQVEEELARLKAAGIRGIKLQPVSQRFFMDSDAAMALYAKVEAQDMILLFHCGKDPGDNGIDYCTPERADAVLRAFPQLKTVLAHLGGMDLWERAAALFWGRPVYLDTAMTAEYTPAEVLEAFFGAHPCEYILFGSDYPWHDDQELTYIKTLPAEVQQAVLYQNGARLLGIE